MIKWRNSAFHDHGTVQKRKLLGGISFDGGGAGGAKAAATPQAGVQTAQSSFLPVSDNLFGTVSGTVQNGTDGIGTVTKQQSVEKEHRDTVSIHNADNVNRTEGVERAETTVIQQVLPAEAGFHANNITIVVENVEEKKRYGILLTDYFKKLKSGIQTFLRSAEQKAGRERKQDPGKKKLHGTRAVTKEEFYEMQADTGYLLDSYNKYGERSTLGKD